MESTEFTIREAFKALEEIDDDAIKEEFHKAVEERRQKLNKNKGKGETKKESRFQRKIRLIWDDCTPTRDRRPTTAEDVEEDVHVQEFNSEEEFVKAVLDIMDYDEYDLEEFSGDTDFEKAKHLMGYCDDPGDGSPNFLYMSVDGKEDSDVAFAYDCLDGLDLEHCTEEQVKDAMKVFIDESLKEELEKGSKESKNISKKNVGLKKEIKESLKIVSTLDEFIPWTKPANDVLGIIYSNHKAEEFEEYMEKKYPEGISEEELTKVLQAQSKEILNALGIEGEEVEESCKLKEEKSVKTPRGEFELVDKTEDELKKAGYGFHHSDKGVKVFTKDNKAVAIKEEYDEDLSEKIEKVLDEYGILYGDIVENDDGSVNIVGVAEKEWPEVVDAISSELSLNVLVPDEDHEEFDDELIVMKESKKEEPQGMKDRIKHNLKLIKNQPLEEEIVNLNDKEAVEKAKEILDKKEEAPEEEVIVDADAETIDKVKDSYMGNAILQCQTCHTLRFVEPDSLLQDEANKELYNIDDECPHCGSTDGYWLVGQVSDIETKPVEEPVEETEVEIEKEIPEIEEKEEVEIQEEPTTEE